MSLLSIVISLFIFFPTNEICEKNALSAFDKKQFYTVFASSELNSINTELTLLSAHSSKSAYEGALLMKKASIIGNPKDKLTLFKQGRTKLETSIKSNPHIIEYLFLRYMVQENSPAFLGYHDNLEEDKKKIISNYSTFEDVVKEAIQNYSKTSKTLSSIQF